MQEENKDKDEDEDEKTGARADLQLVLINIPLLPLMQPQKFPAAGVSAQHFSGLRGVLTLNPPALLG